MVRSIFLALSGLGLVFGIIVNTKTADLYEGNAHHTIGWVATGMVVVHASIDVLLRFTKPPRTDHSEAAESNERSCCPSISTIHQNMYSRRSGINGQDGGLSYPYSAHQHPLSGERARSETDDDDESEDEYKSLVPGRRCALRNHLIHKYLPRRVPGWALSGMPRMLKFLHKVIDWTILVVGYVTLVTGGVTYAGIFVRERRYV